MHRAMLLVLFVIPGVLSAEVALDRFEVLPEPATPTLFETAGFLDGFDLDHFAAGYSIDVRKEWGNYSIGGGLGFALDPGAFLSTFELDVWVLPQLSFGPIVQLALSRTVIFATTGSVKGYLVHDDWAWNDVLQPYAHVGIGWELISRHRRSGSAAAVMISTGIGADVYPFETNQVSIGVSISFNWAPTEPKDKPFFASFTLINAKYHF